MGPEKLSNQTQFDLFRLQLDNIINRNHEILSLPVQFPKSYGINSSLRKRIS